jgi:hypothetical protein
MTPTEYRTLVNRLATITESPDDPGDLGQMSGWEFVDGPLPGEETAPTAPESTDQIKRAEGMQQLKTRAEAIVQRLATVAKKGMEYALIVNIEVIIEDNPDNDLSSVARTARVYIDYSQWDDAPDDVLTWSIAHEVGHIVMEHKNTGNTQQQLQQQELAADAYATQLCLKLGISRAPAFKWANDKRDRLERKSLGTTHQLKLNIMSDPANSDYYRNQASHPTYQQRFDAAGQQGFDLSQADTDQLDRFIQHMSRAA